MTKDEIKKAIEEVEYNERRSTKETLKVEGEALPHQIRNSKVIDVQISFLLVDERGNISFHHVMPKKSCSLFLARDVIHIQTGKKESNHMENFVNFIEDEDIEI